MRGRLNILAFNLPENNSDSPELSRWQPVTQSTLLRPEALLAGGRSVTRHCHQPSPHHGFLCFCGCFCFSGGTNKQTSVCQGHTNLQRGSKILLQSNQGFASIVIFRNGRILNSGI